MVAKPSTDQTEDLVAVRYDDLSMGTRRLPLTNYGARAGLGFNYGAEHLIADQGRSMQ